MSPTPVSCSDYSGCTMLFQGHEQRLGSLEETTQEILHASGQVVQSMADFSEHFNDLKQDIKEIKSDVSDFKLTNANYAARLSSLEQEKNLAQGRVLNRRMQFSQVILGVITTLITAALVYKLGWK